MKITLSAAMRARDVSRPRPEQVADAVARDEPTASPASTPAPAEEAAQPRARRRRRRTR